MTPTCAVCLLGKFTVAVDGELVSSNAWRNRRAAGLVKLLAIQQEHRLHREQVMDALWPELPAESAGANLRKAVHYARRALGRPEAVQLDGHLIALWPHGMLTVDLARFEADAEDAVNSGDVRRCADVAAGYPGDLLPGDRYEPWASEPRARARDRFVALLRCSGQWERLLELDETDEGAHRALMKKYLAEGNRREALRQFERLRHALREHIGVGPDAATVAVYESALAMEGDEPPTLSERAAATLANGLVAWARRDLAEAERLAQRARSLALRGGLGHELGEASTLLALIAYARGTWHALFRWEFADSVRRDAHLEMAVYDAHLCFQEFYLYGPEGHEGAEAFRRDLLNIASRANSPAGQALAHLLLAEFALLSGNLDAALPALRRSLRRAEDAGCVSAQSIALERLAEAETARGRSGVARGLLSRAMELARSSGIPSHLVVRVYGVAVLAAESVVDALAVVHAAERWLTDAPRVCDPCSMNLRIEAARTCARAGDLTRARRHLAEAERITGLWQGGPWSAAVWEARAELRRAEGQAAQADALFLEAAECFAKLRRPVEASRCRSAAAAR